MSKNIWIITSLVLLVIVAGAIYFADDQNETQVASFQECVEAGYPVQESFPRQCTTPDGQSFTEDIGNVADKQDLITIDNPRPNQTVSSPLEVAGEARGTWYFEADFPIRLEDANGNQIAQGVAQAQDDWMTEQFVPYEATLNFSQPQTSTGTLILEKANPSGLPQNADEMHLPVSF